MSEIGALRGRLQGGIGRLRDRGWPVLQTALAAGLAYFLAKLLLGHPQPFFAAVAAVITLGASVGWAVNRAIQVILGVSLGLVIADLLVLFVLGAGPLQLAVVLAVAMGAVVFFGGGPLLLTQIAISSIIVVTLEAPQKGFSLDRVFDALVGIGLALVIGVLLPVDPERRIARASRPVLDALATTLEGVAASLESRDETKAEGALLEARETDDRVDELRASLNAARDTARLSPVRRRSLDRLQSYLTAAENLDLAVPNARVLSRSALRLLRKTESTPNALPAAVLNLSRAVRGLASYLDGSPRTTDDVRRYALAAGRGATGVLDHQRDLATSALVGQIRSTAVDLLRATGMDYTSALDALEEAAGDPPADAPEPAHKPGNDRSA